jgi:hypothetical protein
MKKNSRKKSLPPALVRQTQPDKAAIYVEPGRIYHVSRLPQPHAEKRTGAGCSRPRAAAKHRWEPDTHRTRAATGSLLMVLSIVTAARTMSACSLPHLTTTERVTGHTARTGMWEGKGRGHHSESGVTTSLKPRWQLGTALTPNPSEPVCSSAPKVSEISCVEQGHTRPFWAVSR